MVVRRSNSSRFSRFVPWIDVLAILAWGILLLKYRVTGELNILIHPNYFALTVLGGIALLIVGGIKAKDLLDREGRFPGLGNGYSREAFQSNEQHITLFAPGWSSGLLLFAAILGFIISPSVFASEKALQRSVNDFLPVTRVQPQAFTASVKPEERSLIDWVRTLAVYPEPDAYAGQKVKVQGFVIHLPEPELPEEYLLVARFIITCCAADAYPVGLPVKLSASRDAYPPDTWIEVEGQMMTETLADRRQLVILPSSIREISKPKNPYEY